VYKQPAVPATVAACGVAAEESPDIVPISIAKKKPAKKRAAVRRKRISNQ
jgi:hypothetical protein